MRLVRWTTGDIFETTHYKALATAQLNVTQVIRRTKQDASVSYHNMKAGLKHVELVIPPRSSSDETCTVPVIKG